MSVRSKCPSGVRRLAFALLLIVLPAACGGSGSPAPAAAHDTGAAVAAEAAGENAEPPPQPELFSPGRISDGQWQYRITFTPDGRTAYYTVAPAFFPAIRRATIMVSELQADGSWSVPRIAPFSGTYTDIDPFISPDGSRLFFSSIRPEKGAEREALDVFVVERTAAGWSEAVRLGPEINSDLDELYPSMDRDGTLYFASGPPAPSDAARWNIYRAASSGDGFAPREAVDAVNTSRPFDPQDPTADWEFNPEISPDGRMLIFASLRPGGHGSGDLYVSHRVDGGWTAPQNLGPGVNSADDEFHPTLSRDGQTLYFARTILTPELVPANFYHVAVDAVPALQKP